MLCITTDEYLARLDRLKTGVRKAGLDLFIVSAFDSIFYLTGAGYEPLERPFFLIIRPDGEPSPLTPLLDRDHLKKARGIKPENIHSYREYPAPQGDGWPERLAAEIGAALSIGIEPTLTQEVFAALAVYKPQMLPLVEELRLVKTATEISMIRRAAGYAVLAVKRLLAMSYYGATVAEGFAETRAVVKPMIRDVPDWDPLTSSVLMASWAAPHSAQPHSVPKLFDVLKEGPHVALALTRCNGYAAECERTYFTAAPDEQTLAAFKAMTEARRLAFGLVRPGMPCAEIDARVNEFLCAEGYADDEQRLHRTGHGLGLGNHEAPWLAEGSDQVLEENMVLSVEPGIYLDGVGGIRHSDTVLVTGDGFVSLTEMPTDIASLTTKGLRPMARFKGWVVRRALKVSQKRTATLAAGK
ncbi:MAG: M24 family metallopeptidase [Paracoccaceae bacterium]